MRQVRAPNRFLAAGLLILVAALGVLGGIVLDRMVLRPFGPGASGVWAMHDGLHDPHNPASRSELREHLGELMGADLDLSDEQRRELSLILERHEKRLARALADTRPRLYRIVEEIHGEIQVILTPQQRERFERVWMSRHRELFPGGQPDPPDPADPPDEEPATD